MLPAESESLESHLPPHVAKIARKAAEVLEEPRPATACHLARASLSTTTPYAGPRGLLPRG